MEGAPDPAVLHPVSGQERVVFLKPLVTDPRIEVGEYTYYCALASGVRFVMPGANHAVLGPSSFTFGIFGEPWSERTMDLVMGAPSRGDTVPTSSGGCREVQAHLK